MYALLVIGLLNWLRLLLLLLLLLLRHSSRLMGGLHCRLCGLILSVVRIDGCTSVQAPPNVIRHLDIHVGINVVIVVGVGRHVAYAM